MLITNTHIRVRYGETDQMGYLYYGNYALYYEVGRAEMIRELGLTYKTLEEQGIIMPVAELRSKYIRPARYDDLLRVQTTLRDWPHDHKITFHTELFGEADNLLHAGSTTLVFLDRATGRRTDMPALLAERLRPYFPKS